MHVKIHQSLYVSAALTQWEFRMAQSVSQHRPRSRRRSVCAQIECFVWCCCVCLVPPLIFCLSGSQIIQLPVVMETFIAATPLQRIYASFWLIASAYTALQTHTHWLRRGKGWLVEFRKKFNPFTLLLWHVSPDFSTVSAQRGGQGVQPGCCICQQAQPAVHCMDSKSLQSLMSLFICQYLHENRLDMLGAVLHSSVSPWLL